jgi:hypothetical protein
VGHACREPGNLRSFVRRGEGFRADLADREHAGADSRDKASQGTSGVGSAGHVAGVFFQNVTGTRYQFVPYRGLAPAMAALLAGQVDMMIDVPTSSLPHVRSGSIKAYAVMNKSRIASAPDIPTVDEAGLPGFYALVWYSLWAPKRTPMDVISKLNAARISKRKFTGENALFRPFSTARHQANVDQPERRSDRRHVGSIGSGCAARVMTAQRLEDESR